MGGGEVELSNEFFLGSNLKWHNWNSLRSLVFGGKLQQFSPESKICRN